jgi:CBS domain containing-hemolysin-like protein
VKASGVEPVERPAQDADTIRELVAHSKAAGTLEEQCSAPIALGSLTVDDIVRSDRPPTSVVADADVAGVLAVAASSGHLRTLIGSGATSRVTHVRVTLTVPAGSPAAEGSRQAMRLAPGASAYARMRRDRVQPATVVDGDRLLGVVTLDDLLRGLLPGSADGAAH